MKRRLALGGSCTHYTHNELNTFHKANVRLYRFVTIVPNNTILKLQPNFSNMLIACNDRFLVCYPARFT
jgi:hypothetical protein